MRIYIIQQLSVVGIKLNKEERDQAAESNIYPISGFISFRKGIAMERLK